MKFSIKLLICYHKKDVLIKDDIFTPIHVGRAIARSKMKEDDSEFKWLSENMLGDDSGENISEKNSSYNELTAVYWAWKNYEKLGNPDYIGLMHYRRHFIFRESNEVVENVNGIDDNYFKRINYNPETISHLFDDCDYVAHIGHVDEVYKHYKENHHIEDLDLAIKILKNKYPDYSATADAYLKMSYVNLCNMFIMPRKMFFEYCRWIFDILEEFEKLVDLSEKRLFISERLTGIFIEHQKRNGYKQKALPATFVQSDMHVAVAMPYSDAFKMSVTISSLVRNAESTTHIDFYILHCGEASGNEFAGLLHSDKHSISFINVFERLSQKEINAANFKFPEHYPLIVSEVLEKYNKLLYFDERVFFFGDVARFYLACNNDEYMVLGLQDKDNQFFIGNAFSLNALRLRSHNFAKLISCIYNKSAGDIFIERIRNSCGAFPWWLFNISDIEHDGNLIYADKSRGDKRWGTWEHAMLYYCDGTEPWRNIQALYSSFWWEIAATIPASIPFSGVDNEAAELWYDQSAALCDNCFGARNQSRHKSDRTSELVQSTNVFKRAWNYFRRHGLKQTIKKIIIKILGR